MTLLPHSLVITLRELHLRLYATRIPLATLRDFLRACPSLETLDISVAGDWSHEDLPNDTRPESVRHPERAPWKERIHFEYLKQAKVVVGTDQAAIDLWCPIHGSPELLLQLVYSSDKSGSGALPRVRDVLIACESEMDNASYDGLELRMPEGYMGRSDLRLCLSSSSTNASCDILFPTDGDARKTVLSLLPSYIPTALPHITSFTLNALAADIFYVDETFGALKRALTGVATLNFNDIQFWSAASHVRILRVRAVEA